MQTQQQTQYENNIALFSDINDNSELEVQHLYGVGAVFYHRNKRVTYSKGQQSEFSHWCEKQFSNWVASHC